MIARENVDADTFDLAAGYVTAFSNPVSQELIELTVLFQPFAPLMSNLHGWLLQKQACVRVDFVGSSSEAAANEGQLVYSRIRCEQGKLKTSFPVGRAMAGAATASRFRKDRQGVKVKGDFIGVLLSRYTYRQRLNMFPETYVHFGCAIGYWSRDPHLIDIGAQQRAELGVLDGGSIIDELF